MASTVGMTIQAFWDSECEPRLNELGYKRSRFYDTRNVIRRLLEFAGDIPVSELTDDLANQFREHLWATTSSRDSYRQYWCAFRKFVLEATKKPIRHRSLRPILPEPVEGTFRHYFESTYVPFQLLGRSADTVEAYRGSFWHLHQHFERDVLLSELSNHLIAVHFQWKLDQGAAPTTVNRVRSQLFAVWRHAHSLGACHSLPSLRKLPIELSAPDAWSGEQLKRIVANCRVLKGELIAGRPAEKWWRAALLVVYYTAIRRKTMLALRWEQVDLNESVITTTPRTMKGKRGQKYLIGPDAVQALQSLRDEPQRGRWPLVFGLSGKTVDPKKIGRQFDRILTAAKVKGSISNTPHFHKLRRTVATMVADKKGIGAAAELLAHRSDTVTQRYIDRSLLSGHDFRDVLKPLIH